MKSMFNEEFSDESQVESTEDLTAYLAQFDEDMIKEILKARVDVIYSLNSFR